MQEWLANSSDNDVFKYAGMSDLGKAPDTPAAPSGPPHAPAAPSAPSEAPAAPALPLLHQLRPALPLLHQVIPATVALLLLICPVWQRNICAGTVRS